jgi:hypothetical protein
VASEVGARLQPLETGCLDQGPHRGILVITMLQHQEASRLEAKGRLERDLAYGVQAIGTGSQGG